MMRNSVRSITLALAVFLLIALVDLHVMVLIEAYVLEKMATPREIVFSFFLCVPQFFFGMFAALAADCVAGIVASAYFRTTVFFFLTMYLIWKFQSTQVWMAPEVLAYLLAIGPYFAFLSAFCVTSVLMARRKSGNAQRL